MGVFFGLAAKNAPESVAVKATDFNAGRIIDDELFYNPNTMTVEEIQAHLDKYSASCDMWGEQAIGYGRKINGVAVNPNVTRREYARMMREAGRTDYHDAPYVCISKYYENPETHKTNFDSAGKVEEGMISAAQIIYDAAHAYNINPQVLLVMLKKESYVWGDTWPLKNEYNTVMGYACPDNAPCDSAYFGFYNQVMKAAWQLNYYKEHIYSYGYYPYMTNNIYYSPNYSCGTKAVYLENIATTSLYIYTPYTPNDAALANYPGEAYCGSYGNRNFFMYFSEWFGSTYVKVNTEKIDAYAKDKNYLGKEIQNSYSCVGDICYKRFEYGYVLSDDTEIWDIHGGIFSKWIGLSGISGALGIPLSGEKYADGYAYQEFKNGSIYWSETTDSLVISGSVYSEWKKNKELVGYPTSDAIEVSKELHYQKFQNGNIYYDNKTAWFIRTFAIESWDKVGGVKSYLGMPTDTGSCAEDGITCSQVFKGGYVYQVKKDEIYIVHGGIMDRWKKEKDVDGYLGLPAGPEKKDDAGNTYQDYAGGRIYWNSKNGTWVINSFAVTAFEAVVKNNYLGMPTTAGVCGIKDNGCYQLFENGRIYWSEKTGSVNIHGGILQRWISEGLEWKYLGYPTSKEQSDDNGVYQEFEGGRVYWSNQNGTWIIRDYAVDLWNKVGGIKSYLGMPKDVGSCNAQLCYQTFKGGEIYKVSNEESYAVHGGILDRWKKEGKNSGKLGLPSSNEQVSEDGTVYQVFANGKINWSNAKGTWISN